MNHQAKVTFWRRKKEIMIWRLYPVWHFDCLRLSLSLN